MGFGFLQESVFGFAGILGKLPLAVFGSWDSFVGYVQPLRRRGHGRD
jgi:hypothetical protein